MLKFFTSLDFTKTSWRARCVSMWKCSFHCFCSGGWRYWSLQWRRKSRRQWRYLRILNLVVCDFSQPEYVIFSLVIWLFRNCFIKEIVYQCFHSRDFKLECNVLIQPANIYGAPEKVQMLKPEHLKNGSPASSTLLPTSIKWPCITLPHVFIQLVSSIIFLSLFHWVYCNCSKTYICHVYVFT